jgi:hypothetical protein
VRQGTVVLSVRLYPRCIACCILRRRADEGYMPSAFYEVWIGFSIAKPVPATMSRVSDRDCRVSRAPEMWRGVSS